MAFIHSQDHDACHDNIIECYCRKACRIWSHWSQIECGARGASGTFCDGCRCGQGPKQNGIWDLCKAWLMHVLQVASFPNGSSVLQFWVSSIGKRLGLESWRRKLNADLWEGWEGLLGRSSSWTKRHRQCRLVSMSKERIVEGVAIYIYIYCRESKICPRFAFFESKICPMFPHCSPSCFSKSSSFCRENETIKRGKRRPKITISWVNNLSNHVAQHTWTDFWLNLFTFWPFFLYQNMPKPLFCYGFQQSMHFLAHPQKLRTRFVNTTALTDFLTEFYLFLFLHFSFFLFLPCPFLGGLFLKGWQNINWTQNNKKQDPRCKQEDHLVLYLVLSTKKETDNTDTKPCNFVV